MLPKEGNSHNFSTALRFDFVDEGIEDVLGCAGAAVGDFLLGISSFATRLCSIPLFFISRVKQLHVSY